MSNGRITLDLSNSKEYDFNNKNMKPIFNTQYISGIEKTPLYNGFFSSTNIDVLQNSIIQNVASCSNNYDISRQDENTLIIIMKSIYLQYVQNLNNVNKEIQIMNSLVIDYCVKNIVSNIKHYIFYLKDISKLPQPLEHPKYMRSDGLKNYRSIIDD